MAAAVGGRLAYSAPLSQLVTVQSNKPVLTSQTVQPPPGVVLGSRGLRAVGSSRHLQPSARSWPSVVSLHSRRAELQDRTQAVSEEAAESITEEVSEQEEVPQEGGDQAPPPSGVQEVVQRYREAIANGDETGIQEAEVQLEAIEKDREYLSQQVASLTEEMGLSKERFLRLNADFDNFRKRADREKIALSSKVTGDVVEVLLPIVDTFERAKSAIKAETEIEQKIDNSYQGIYKLFVDAMKSLGVSAVETAGKEFDPNVHDAIMREESTEYPEGFIIEEFRKGFTIGEKLLRPAMVKVSAGPGPADAAPPAEDPASASSEAVGEPASVEGQ